MNRKSSLLEMLKSEPSNSFLLYALAKEYESEGDLDGAIAQLEKLKALDPDYTGLYYHLAQMYYSQDNISQAITVVQDGISSCKRNSDQHSLSELQTLLINFQIEN
ncbi:MAG: tetratricopeptide repeat protein [Saprospiraceae bacterium]|nr:tetratricopeptide repeat protein [Saprospiraceae bacterium]